MHYVKHMIPSTAILSYKIKGEESDVINYSPAISLHGNYSPDYTSGGVETKQIRYSLVTVNVWQDEDDKYYLRYEIEHDQLDSEHTVNMQFKLPFGGMILDASFYNGQQYVINGQSVNNGGYTGISINDKNNNNKLDIIVNNPFYSYDEEISGETVTHLVSVNLYVQKNNL